VQVHCSAVVGILAYTMLGSVFDWTKERVRLAI
jgi:hypothetical protein